MTEPTAPRVITLPGVFYFTALFVMLVVILVYGAALLAPIALSILIWFLINALASGISRAPVIGRYLSRRIAMTLAVIFIFAVIVEIGQIMAANVSELSASVTRVDERLSELLNPSTAALGLEGEVDWRSLVGGLELDRLLSRIISAAGSVAGNISVVFLYVAFLLLDQQFFYAKLRALAPDPDRRERTKAVFAQISQDTRRYLLIMTLVSGLVGLATTAVCAALGLSGAGFWGVLAFALNFMPTIGTFLGVAFPALYALLQFETLQELFILVGALAALQFVAGNILVPKMMGDRLNLSQFVVILSLFAWGAVWGVTGMFLAVPVTVIMMIVFAQFETTRPIAILLSRDGSIRPVDSPNSTQRSEPA
jgi:AI-2 transport protein TqsA